MRLVNVNDLEAGMVIAKPIYNQNGGCLVNINYELNDKIIERIKTLDYDKVWIGDEFNNISDHLSDELKTKAVRTIKSVFTGYTSKKATFDAKKIEELKGVVEIVVDEIIKNSQCVVQLSNLKSYNNSMYEHAVDVARVSVLIGANMGLQKEKLIDLCQAAMLHDVGKTQISSFIFSKTTEYTKEEIEEITKHPTLSFNILKNSRMFSAPVYVPTLHHHERFDGKGYPEGIKGDKINLYARIIRIADVYSNLRSGTINTKPIPQEAVLEYFYADGSKQFDPAILKVFLAKVPVYEVGQVIKLSNGKKAFVVQNNEEALARPIVRVLEDNKKVGEEIDLFKNLNITVIA